MEFYPSHKCILKVVSGYFGIGNLPVIAMNYEMVSDEDFKRIRTNSVIYMMPFMSSLSYIVKVVIPDKYLLDLARGTIWKSQKEDAEDSKQRLKKMERDLRRGGTRGDAKLALGVAKAASALRTCVKEYDKIEEDLEDKLYVLLESSMMFFDGPDPIKVEGYNTLQILRDYKIDERDRRHIHTFGRAVVHKLNSTLKEEIKEAEGMTFGYVFDELIEKFREYGSERAYRMAWAFLVNESAPKNFLASVLAYYAKIVSELERIEFAAKEINSIGRELGSDAPPITENYPIDPAGLGWKVLGEMFKPFKDDSYATPSMRRIHLDYLEAFAANILSETLREYRGRMGTQRSLDLERARREELTGKLVTEAKDREVALSEKEKEVGEKDKEISELTARLAELGETNLTKLGATVKNQSEAIKKRDRRIESLEESEELLERENDVLWREVRKLRKKSESGRLGKNPYFVLRDELDGTAWSDSSDEVTALMYGAFRREVVSGKLKVGEKRLIKIATEELPENRKETDLGPVFERLKAAGVYTDSRGLSLNTNTDDITDDALRKIVERMIEMKEMGEI